MKLSQALKFVFTHAIGDRDDKQRAQENLRAAYNRANETRRNQYEFITTPDGDDFRLYVQVKGPARKTKGGRKKTGIQIHVQRMDPPA